MVGEDALVGDARERQQGKQAEGVREPHSTRPRSTSGTFATSSADFWKNSRCRKPKAVAIRLCGTDSMRVFSARTAPL